MSNETSEFGGWRKQPKVSVWRPKAKDRPYVVARADGDEPAYTATFAPQEAMRPGEAAVNPELLDTIPVFFSEAGAGDEKRARETAQHVCERHWQTRAAKLSVASGGQLDWSYEEDTHVYTAPAADGRTYSCEEDDDGRCYVALDGDEIGPDAAKGHKLEAAQAICQWHADTELRWREAHPGEIWVATSARLFPSEDYTCDLYAVGSDDWVPEFAGDSIGDLQSLEQAKEACQDHHREAHPYEAPAPEPVAEPKLPSNGELGEWSIPVVLTEAELAQLAKEISPKMARIGRLTVAIAKEKVRSKERVKGLEAAIAELTAEALPLADVGESGEEYRLVECLRHKDQEARELYYTHPGTGEELHRHAVPKGEQQQLWGGSKPPPADKPPEPEPLPAEAEEATDHEPLDPSNGDIDMIPGVKADPLPVDLDLSDKQNWKPIDLDGRRAYRTYGHGDCYVVSQHETSKLRLVTFEPDAGEPRKLNGSHKTLKDAFGAAHQDNQRRLRWPSTGADKHVLLSHDGRYQLHQVRGDDDSWPDAWRAELVGCLGAQNEQLNGDDGDPLAVAQEVCQDHATEQRGAGQ